MNPHRLYIPYVITTEADQTFPIFQDFFLKQRRNMNNSAKMHKLGKRVSETKESKD